VAARITRDRRHLGKPLVRRGGKIDIVSALHTARRGCPGSSPRDS
jgi:hypothetical protein